MIRIGLILSAILCFYQSSAAPIKQEKVLSRVRCRLEDGELVCDLLSNLRKPTPDMLQRLKCLYIKDELSCDDVNTISTQESVSSEDSEENKEQKSQPDKLKRILDDLKLFMRLKDAEKEQSVASRNVQPIEQDRTAESIENIQPKEKEQEKRGTNCWYELKTRKYVCLGK